jgi:hypothetical protein
MQLEIFSYPKQISDELFTSFDNANAGDYPFKQDFYTKLKLPFLFKFGKFAGYDLQTITKKCDRCNGTGKYHGYILEACYCCDATGIYAVNNYTLERFILNNKLFHIPNFGKQDVVYINHFKEILKHDDISYLDAVKGFFTIAIELNYQLFLDDLIDEIKNRNFLKNVELRDYIQELITKHNDELPF